MKKNLSFLFAACCLGVLFFACQKEYSMEVGNTQVAAGSLWDSAGNCLPDTVVGTFYEGVTPGSDTAYVEIQVDVTQTGSYSINTGKADNGLVFSDSGFFSNTGINTIRLKPSGTPILVKSSVYNISFDSSFCSFTVNVQDSTGTGLGGQQDTTGQGGDPDGNSGTWQFTTDGKTFGGSVDTAFIGLDTAIWGSGGKVLDLVGFTSNVRDTAMFFWLYLPNGVITPGTYETQLEPPSNAGVFAFVDNASSEDGGDPIYESAGILGSSTQTNVIVNITSYDSNTHVIKGTFSGTAEVGEDTGVTTTISNGSFTATVSP